MNWKKLSIVAGSVVSLLTILAISNSLWGDLGWVTHAQYSVDRQSFVPVTKFDSHLQEYNRHVAMQQAINEMHFDTQNEILAHVKLVPQIRALIRVKCRGDRTLDVVIADLARQYVELTGVPYVEPPCDDPRLELGQ